MEYRNSAFLVTISRGGEDGKEREWVAHGRQVGVAEESPISLGRGWSVEKAILEAEHGVRSLVKLGIRDVRP